MSDLAMEYMTLFLQSIHQAKGEDAACRGIYGVLRGVFAGKVGTSGGESS